MQLQLAGAQLARDCAFVVVLDTELLAVCRFLYYVEVLGHAGYHGLNYLLREVSVEGIGKIGKILNHHPHYILIGIPVYLYNFEYPGHIQYILHNNLILNMVQISQLRIFFLEMQYPPINNQYNPHQLLHILKTCPIFNFLILLHIQLLLFLFGFCCIRIKPFTMEKLYTRMYACFE